MHPVLSDLVERYPDLAECSSAISASFTLLSDAYRAGGKLLLCGNGGSAADCDHIVGELMKGFTLPRPVPADVREALTRQYPQDGAALADSLQGALPAISLASQQALTTAFANDVAPEMMFAQGVYGYGQTGDVLLGISTSGNSMNVLNALKVARVRGLHTIGLTGQTGGAMYGLCDVCICVPYTVTAQVQERHLPVYHALCTMLEQEFFE